MNARTWLLLVVLGCGGGKGGGPATTTTTNTADGTSPSGDGSTGTGSAQELTGVGIALDIQPTEAKVTIDDIVMGSANELDPVVSLAPGLHTLVVEHAGFKSYRAEFSVTDKVEKFTVRLEVQK